MRYPILVLLTTLVVTSLGATGQGEMESVVAFNIVTSGVNEVFRSLIMLMMIPCFLLLCMVQREWVVWLSAFVWMMGVFAMPLNLTEYLIGSAIVVPLAVSLRIIIKQTRSSGS